MNLYGPQRFGAGQSVKADQVGLALLKEDMVRTFILDVYAMAAKKSLFKSYGGEDLASGYMHYILLMMWEIG